MRLSCVCYHVFFAIIVGPNSTLLLHDYFFLHFLITKCVLLVSWFCIIVLLDDSLLCESVCCACEMNYSRQLPNVQHNSAHTRNNDDFRLSNCAHTLNFSLQTGYEKRHRRPKQRSKRWLTGVNVRISFVLFAFFQVYLVQLHRLNHDCNHRTRTVDWT